MRCFLILLLLWSITGYGQNANPPIGQWREHLPYQGAIDVAATDQKIWAATLYSLFCVDRTTQEIERVSKVAGLSETGISRISYDPVSQKLYVAYSNSNIDVLDAKGIHNIPDLKRSNLSGDKMIYHIFPDNSRCYLSTGLGVLVVDAAKFEIKESWFIGTNGGYVKTWGFTKDNGWFYAATEEGLKRAPVASPNPADFQAWQTLSGSNGLSAAPSRAVVALQGKIITLQNDSLFVLKGATWSLFFANGWPVVSVNASEGKLLVSQRMPSGAAQVVSLDAGGAVLRSLQQDGVISFPRNAVRVNNEYWIADQYGGLSWWPATAPTAAEVFKPNSPEDIATGGVTVYNNTFYATAGSVNEAWNYQYNRSGIFKYSNDYWTAYNQYHFPQLDTVMDLIAIAIDPRDESVWGASYGGGLLHIKPNNSLEIFKQSSPIGPMVGDPLSYRVAGLAFDGDQNLWISNYGSTTPLKVLKADGTWQSFTVPFFLTENATAGIVIDDAGQKWIVSPKENGLLVLNDNNTISNTADDRWKLYRVGPGSGNLPSNDVRAIAKDKSGFLWVGTANGIGVIQCPESAFNPGCDAVWPVIKEGAFASYLFKGEQVRSIAVDGADRKWIATPNGAWLVNRDGDAVLAHFTESNSPLLSNDVKSIAVNGQTGEVFFATAKGMISFRGGATEAAETKSDVLVFPNPVPPGYTGTIGIRGLPENSIVKITGTDGRLVYQTRSLGGQATWNGRNYRGQQAATGIYLVLAVDENKQEKVVTKIVFISR